MYVYVYVCMYMYVVAGSHYLEKTETRQKDTYRSLMCMNLCMYVYVYVCMYVYVCVCMYMYVAA